ncbi:TonB-dependent receptor [Lacihabitans sp. LS3-19]|uniref:TonB-dependent receptor plug domain-containing protein n=1 Tax=Lacihabitans sp. LS3-19 TaxID=2487335 RepID=UPI0020CDE88C|nr:TonB-dependent receptor [Lacihabitans sp. LS3-19]MCP9770492.1 TonB-dependent receptor [Lacihabitans sp. LS3-19]
MNLLFFLQISATIISSGPDSSINKTNLLNEVVVTANRSESRIFSIPATISSVNSKYIESHLSRTTPEILMGTAGVFVQKTNHGGGSPFVRGLTGNQTLLLVDGIRLNNSTFRYGPNQYFNTIDPFSISKIEVLKGEGSVAYGSDALGGTIQVFTKDPIFSSGFHGNVYGRMGTQNIEQTGRAEISYGFKNAAIMADFTRRNFGDLPGGKNTGIQKNSGYGEQMGNFKSIFKIKKGILTLAHQYFEASDVPVYHKIQLEDYKVNQFTVQKRNLSYAKYSVKTKSLLFEQINTTLSRQKTNEKRESQKNGAPNLTEENDQIGTTGLNINFQSNFSKNWKASSGIEAYHDVVQSDKKLHLANPSNPSRGLYPDGSSASSYAVYSLHSYTINKWSFSVGHRFNIIDLRIKDETLGTSELNFKSAVPSIAISYFPNTNSHSYFRYNRGFRAPNIDDMGTLGIVDFRYEIPAYDLKPEFADNFELGYKFQSNPIAITGSIFYNKLSNLITRVKVDEQVINGYPVYIKENVESASLKGFELDLEGKINKSLKYFGNLTYTYGQNITKNEPLRRTPPTFGRTGIEFSKSNFVLRPEFLFASAQKRLASGDISDNRIGPEGTAPWQILNVFSSYSWKSISLNLALQNLGNADYRLHGSGINGVGRSAILGLKLSF